MVNQALDDMNSLERQYVIEAGYEGSGNLIEVSLIPIANSNQTYLYATIVDSNGDAIVLDTLEERNTLGQYHNFVAITGGRLKQL